MQEEVGEHHISANRAVGGESILNIEAILFIPMIGSSEQELVEAAYVAAMGDPSQEGQAVLSFAKEWLSISQPGKVSRISKKLESEVKKRVLDRSLLVREGSLDAIESWVRNHGGVLRNQIRRVVDQVRRMGGTAIVVASDRNDLGVVYLRPLKTVS